MAFDPLRPNDRVSFQPDIERVNFREQVGDWYRVIWSQLPFARTRLSFKSVGELRWLRGEVPKFLAWYQGDLPELWGVSAPSEAVKVRGFDQFLNAVSTFLSMRAGYYPQHLLAPPTHFAGRKLLDVGCGAIPFALGFVDCQIYGVDPLTDEYRALGFPLDQYSDRMTYVKAGAEHMPFEDNFFDAVISVNAIDHVDDIAQSAREISRVLAPTGTARFEVPYHSPSRLEPLALSDEAMMTHFHDLGLRKIAERIAVEDERVGPGQPDDLEEKITVWAND